MGAKKECAEGMLFVFAVVSKTVFSPCILKTLELCEVPASLGPYLIILPGRWNASPSSARDDDLLIGLVESSAAVMTVVISDVNCQPLYVQCMLNVFKLVTKKKVLAK